MTKKDLMDIVNYSNWVDGTLINWIEQIDDRQWEMEIESSFNSIAKTVLHIVSAKKVWIDFWQNNADPVFLSTEFTGTKSELIVIWKKVMEDYMNLIEHFPQEEYSKIISLIIRGEKWNMEFYQTVLHQNNHATYHRGQLVTMLRQAGFRHLSNTDLATYYVKINNVN